MPTILVNDLYDCIVKDGFYRIKKNKSSSYETVPNEDINDVVNAILYVIRNPEPLKDKNNVSNFTFIPARALFNALFHVSETFRERQEIWLQKNKVGRNTGDYTKFYYNALHVLNHENKLKYYKKGVISDFEPLLTAKELKVYKKIKKPTLDDYV